MPATDPHADRLVSHHARVFDHIPLRIQIDIGRGRRRRFLAIINKVGRAVGHPDQHEPATTQIPRLRMHHHQREPRSHRRIHRVPARLHDLGPGS